MMMPGRSYAAESGYRYGFNGKENDNEVKGEGNQQDYGMRIYDPRIGKFLSVDPLTSDYPFYTPYQFAGNKPVWCIDLDGLEDWAANEGYRVKQQAEISIQSADRAATIKTYNPSWTQKWRESNNFFAKVSYSMANGLYTFPQQLSATMRGTNYVSNIGGNYYNARGRQDESQRNGNFVDFASTVIPGAPATGIVKGQVVVNRLADEIAIGVQKRIEQETGKNISKIHARYPDGIKVFEGVQPARIQIAENEFAQSVIRWDESNVRVYAAREFGQGGVPVRDIDFAFPTYPNGVMRPNHFAPEVHLRVSPSTGGTPERLKDGTPLYSSPKYRGANLFSGSGATNNIFKKENK